GERQSCENSKVSQGRINSLPATKRWFPTPHGGVGRVDPPDAKGRAGAWYGASSQGNRPTSPRARTCRGHLRRGPRSKGSGPPAPAERPPSGWSTQDECPPAARDATPARRENCGSPATVPGGQGCGTASVHRSSGP